jgi:hypothetical protein
MVESFEPTIIATGAGQTLVGDNLVMMTCKSKLEL